jgi:hypothetical protein
VRYNHPAFRAADSRVRAAEGSRVTAKSFGNPILGYQVDQTPFPGGRPIVGMEREAMTTATLPLDVQISATYQFSRGIQTGGAAPSVLATWGTTPASATTLGRAYSANATTKTVNLVAVGDNYGFQNLNQLDMRASKRFTLNQVRLRLDFDPYNIFNSDWPFSVTNTFSTATSSAWLRPTNVLQARFFKIGAGFDF